jgi:DNA-binding response OmpR family regulator
MHALIIEDEPLIAMAIEDLLRENGYTSFDFAVCAEGAVAAAAKKCPDLITCDVVLKRGSGIDAIEKICGKSRVPAIFITSSPADVRERLVGYPVVRKPFSNAQVAAAVQLVAR